MVSARSLCLRWLLLAASCIALLPACKAPPKPLPPEPVPRELDFRVEASPKLNPDLRDRAMPIVVRIYELRSPQAFQAADFFALFEKDQITLGEDMIAREELQLRPGESTRLPPRELKPDVRAIGVFAAFRDLENSKWRAVAALPAPPPPVTVPPPKPLAVPVIVTLGPRNVHVAVE